MTPIECAFNQVWPQATRVNLLDDSLSTDLAREGEITPAMTQRFIDLTQYAVTTGAQAVLFTCTAFNRCIDAASEAFAIPVLKPDEAMIEKALDYGSRLGLLATFLPTMASATEQIQNTAKSRSMIPRLDAHLVEGALEALQSGDGVTHDRLVAAALQRLGDCDAIMLAQFSMARAAITLDSTPPVLTSPVAAVEKLRGLLQ